MGFARREPISQSTSQIRFVTGFAPRRRTDRSAMTCAALCALSLMCVNYSARRFCNSRCYAAIRAAWLPLNDLSWYQTAQAMRTILFANAAAARAAFAPGSFRSGPRPEAQIRFLAKSTAIVYRGHGVAPFERASWLVADHQDPHLV
jgi:hypothetical protein